MRLSLRLASFALPRASSPVRGKGAGATVSPAVKTTGSVCCGCDAKDGKAIAV